MAVLNAAPFGGGILAGAKAAQGYFAYREAGDETLARIAHLQATAAKYDVPLAAVALQFPMREPRITATLAGCVKPSEVDRLIENARYEIPDALWEEL